MRSMTNKKFEELVAEAVEAIPEKFRAKLENVVFLAEKEPSAEHLEDTDTSEGETLLGLQEGPTLGERKAYPWHLPNRIIIFQNAHEDEARETGRSIAEVVRETVWHEIAHFLGMDEREVEKAEEKRQKRAA